jgi:hypothetical protein
VKETSARVKAELYGTCYRLGDKEALDPIIKILTKADEEVATPILNLIEDLIGRKQPPTMKSDALRIKNILINLSKRIPIVANHAKALVLCLEKEFL